MRLLIALICILLATPAWADDPPEQAPFLRVESGSHLAAIKRISVSADGRLLATGSDDKTARLWNLANGQLIRTFRVPIDSDNGGKVHSVALSPDGRLLAVGGWDAFASASPAHAHFIYVFDTTDGRLVRRLGPLPDVILDMAFSQRGDWLAAGLGYGGVRFWRVANEFAAPPMADENYRASVYGVDFDSQDRLAATGQDGRIRLYQMPNGGTAGLRLLKSVQSPDGRMPLDIAFSPGDDRIAVTYVDSTAVSLLDARSLKSRRDAKVDTSFLGERHIYAVAWSKDGTSLYGAGNYEANKAIQIIAWDKGGVGQPKILGGPIDTVFDLAGLPGGGVAWSASDAEFGVVGPQGGGGVRKPASADLREKVENNFWIAPDAGGAWFGLAYGAADPWRFNVSTLTFEAAPEHPEGWLRPITDRLPVDGWINGVTPRIGGRPLELRNNEISRSLAIAPDARSFVLGTEFSIYRFSVDGQQMWRKPAPAAAWGVDISADGSIIVAALGDGTIRWYRAVDGAELLALFVSVPDKRWVLWTPSGYYAASPGGEDLIGWQVNGGSWDAPVDFYPVSRFRDRFYRPDIVQLVLEIKEERAAIIAANVIAKRRNDDAFSTKDLPPVITIVADARGIEAAEPEVDVHYLLRAPSQRPVSRVEVRIDGQLAQTIAARGVTEAQGASDGSLSITVRIPQRDCDISLVAFHDDQASAPARVHVKWTGAAAPRVERRLFALFVGVSKYDDAQLTLGYADKDATDMAAALKLQEGKFFKEVIPKVLTNTDASRDAIEKALAELRDSAGPDDYTLVFLAGHGTTLQNKFYFLPRDADTAAGRLPATSLGGGYIASQLSAMKGKVLFFIDACYSAQALRFDMSGFVNAVTGEQNAVMMYSSSSGNETSYEGPQWQHGAFSKALLAIFADPASYDENGQIITDELAVQIRKRVNELTDGRQTPIGRASDAVPPFPVAAR